MAYLPQLDYDVEQSNLCCIQIFLTMKPVNYGISIVTLSMKPFYQFYSKDGSHKPLKAESEALTSRDTDSDESAIPKVK